MKKNAILIQQASGDQVPFLQLTRERHAAYATRHGMEFWSVEDQEHPERAPNWEKIVLIQRALSDAAGYEWIFWLDADTMIARLDYDLREGLRPERDLGMVMHPNPRHFNSGVVLVKNTPATHEYFQRAWDAWPGRDQPWEEQVPMNRLLAAEHCPGFQTLPAEFNSTFGVNEALDPVVMAWHGLVPLSERFNRMTAALREFEMLASEQNAQVSP